MAASFKFQLRPDEMVSSSAICGVSRRCRLVFNWRQASRDDNHKAGNQYIPCTKIASCFIEWTSDAEKQWLKASPSQSLQPLLKEPERVYNNCFQQRACCLRFKNCGQNDAFRYPQGVKLDQENNGIFIA